MVYKSKEELALEIREKAGIEIDVGLPEVVYANSVVVKSSYLLFPIQGQDNVLYVDKSNKEIYIYDIEAMEYQTITQKLTPMTDEEVKEMINRIKGAD